jgi:hypothetical protein
VIIPVNCFWRDFVILLFKNSSKNDCQGNFYENFQKNHYILRNKVLKIFKIFEGFRQIFNFLLLKLPYLS